MLNRYTRSLCHTDLAIESGAFPSPAPSIPGHEGAGIVTSGELES